jgi:hypothetical protein
VVEAWFHAGAANGFNVQPPDSPGGVADVVDLIMPDVQRQGLVRHKYERRIQREHLCIERQPHHAAAAGRDSP